MDNMQARAKPIDSRRNTLGLVNIWQVLRKLWWEVLIFRNIPDRLKTTEIGSDLFHLPDARLYAASNLALTCLNLVDWLYYAVESDPELTARTMETLGDLDMTNGHAFMRSLRERHASINLCHQIANATKHSHLHKPDPNFAIRTGDLVFLGSEGQREIVHVSIIEQNGPERKDGGSVFDALLNLSDWWEERLTEIGIPERDLFFPELGQP